MDIQEILKKQQASDQQQIKPKFLSKSQREAIALEKRNKEHAEKQEKLKKQQDQKEEMDRRLLGASREVSLDKDDRTGRDKAKRDRPASPPPPPDDNISSQEIQAIKASYLGEKEKRKRKSRKVAEAKRMNFDWDEEEDTESNALSNAVSRDIRPPPPTSSTGKDQQQFVDHIELRQAKRHGYDSRNWREKELSQMTERDWRIVNEDFNISARGGQIPKPLRSWHESAIPGEILDIIHEIGYKDPSPIQRQAIPIGLNSRDLIGIAETGSGKTASFVIPMMNYISRQQPISEHNYHLGPYALILAPTRELAQQIESETKKFSGPMSFKCLSLVGGKSVDEQSFNLRTGAEIIIATPGRLKDLLERSIIVLSQCNYLVLDEADRMVAMGFEQELNFILEQMGTAEENIQRQTFLYSATMPTAVEHIARKYLRKPAVINIGGAGQAVDTVEQVVELVDTEAKKTKRLLDVLNSDKYAPPIIVFVNQKKSADVLSKELNKARWECTTLHSGKTQDQREEALQSLRDGVVSVLVATDLAGRGIDIADVSLVCNYHMANNIESYIHRIGRTGRAGKKGKAITFVTPHADDEVMYDLKQELDKSPISQTPRDLATHEFAQRRITRQMKKDQQREQEANEMGIDNFVIALISATRMPLKEANPRSINVQFSASAIESPSSTYLVFSEPWCPDCRNVDDIIKKTFDKESAPLAQIVRVGDIASWKSPTNVFRTQWNVQSIPTIIRYDNVGALDVQGLQEIQADHGLHQATEVSRYARIASGTTFAIFNSLEKLESTCSIPDYHPRSPRETHLTKRMKDDSYGELNAEMSRDQLL
ncbi:hypothetical protein E3P89_01537 [Wallemia ichthyophaga]|uniref:RNA helicase n=1 Tax=Wallemia ichthyophaga TaxID=245174 RepID=A0A4T0I7M8_WALIC|nr:hypothetical protein E3P90_01877 [Wallemia ichthyophaga]TIB14433.1 hypothetical protein E3P93_01627 [Wallemia ichthyophaga]TIB23542.1 hypothetical protein E3P89_01537 [Wallemia ichthyophaga]TIB24917.1 hypothetical protein E3P88_01832 [Wallemia ichthyophaga]TIB36546.1 hypothetical protein E3P84_00879 [Wallemia ichthyophaga]